MKSPLSTQEAPSVYAELPRKTAIAMTGDGGVDDVDGIDGIDGLSPSCPVKMT